nr:hypothetical protein KXZ65_21210 [Pectobacterium sp. PL152]
MKTKKKLSRSKFINDIPSLRSIGWRVWLSDENTYHGEFHIANSFSYVVIHNAGSDNNIDSLLNILSEKEKSIYYRQWLNKN